MFVWPTKSKGLQVGASDEATWDRYTMSSLLSQGRVGVWGGVNSSDSTSYSFFHSFSEDLWRESIQITFYIKGPWIYINSSINSPVPPYTASILWQGSCFSSCHQIILLAFQTIGHLKKRNGELVHSLWEHHPEVLHATFTCIHLAKLSPTVISTD